MPSDVSKVKGVIVTVECTHCHGKKRLPGGPYKDQGEVVDCALCRGTGVTQSEITLVMLAALLLPPR